MEGPHGSDQSTPETTVAWLWGFAYGTAFIGIVTNCLWLWHTWK